MDASALNTKSRWKCCDDPEKDPRERFSRLAIVRDLHEMTSATYPGIAAALLCAVQLAVAQEPKGSSARPDQADPQFSGPSSVGAVIEEDARVRETQYRFQDLQRNLKPYFDFKSELDASYGLSFGFDYTALYQVASASPGEKDAAGGIFRAFGVWTLTGRGTRDTGALVYKVESRHRLGSEIAPQGLGFETGYAGLTAAPYGDYDWALTNLFWKQKFGDGRVALVAGQVDVTDYVNVYGLINPWTAFSNLAFLTDPTIPAPNQGLGAALAAVLTENVYVAAGLADANGDPTQPDRTFDSFFDTSEYFSHAEIGWTSAQDRIYLDNVHLTAWHADERKQAGVPGGWGLAFSAAKFIDERWMPFLRLGYAKDGGALWERSVSAGVGYYVKARADLVGFGLNWSRPDESAVGPGLREQTTAELFYRVQLSPNFAVTPDLQLVLNPALVPDKDQVWYFGLRARLAL